MGPDGRDQHQLPAANQAWVMRQGDLPVSWVFAAGALSLAYSDLALFIKLCLCSYSCFAVSAFAAAVIFLWCVKP